MTRLIGIVLLTTMLSQPALATITVWSGNPSNVFIDTSGNVQILASGTYKLHSLTAAGAPDVIRSITVASSVTGTVDVYVRRDPADQASFYGASDVGAIVLANDQGANLTGNLMELRMTGNLGSIGPSVAVSTGSFSIQGDLENTLEAGGLTEITLVGSVTPSGAIVIHGDFSGRMDLQSQVQGSIIIDGDITDSTSRIFIKQLAGGHVECDNLAKAGPFDERFMLGAKYNAPPLSELDIVQSGTITVNGTLSGAIYFRTQTEVHVTVGQINATNLSGDDIGGIFSFGGFRDAFQLDVLGDFVDGSIYVLGTEPPYDLPDPNTVLRDINGTFNFGGDFGSPAQFLAEFRDSNGGAITCNSACPPVNLDATLHVAGDMFGRLYASGDLNGRILIDGALHNSSGDEIEIEGALGAATAAIAVNYDGRSDNENDWESGATVKVDNNVYDETNTADPLVPVRYVSCCKGDMNGDREVDSLDGSPNSSGSPYYLARFDPEQYEADFPGLEGSRCWHGDCDFSANPLNPEDCGFEAADDAAFVNLVEHTCCLTDDQALCPGDVDHDYQVGLADLSALLTNYGTASGATRAQGDLDGDGDVDLTDLSALLTVYGLDCCPTDQQPAPSEGDASISVVAFDTSGYSATGFAGESTHFVFDVLIELEEEDDDWTGCGAAVKRANGATFYVISGASNPPTPGSSQPGRYRSFFSVPYAVTASNRFNAPFPSGSIVGAYSPLGTSYVYSTTDLNANWYDTTGSSDDGPAAVMRVTIDVSGVSGADVSGGFGSVYFSTTGPADGNDIKVADFAAAAAHAFDQGQPEALTGAFYVNGQ